jgi:SSS family solute:Na+ symporter
MTTYFAAGGLMTSAWVNLVQLVVLLGGFAVALPLSLSAVGGWGAVAEMGSAASPSYMNFWRGGASGWTYLALLLPAFVISPGLLQKIYGARDERTVRIGVGANALALLAFACVPPLLGMIARVHHPDLANPELALPALLMYELPLIVGSLALAAVFSAEVSSADALLFMLATSLSQDLYRRFMNPGASDRLVLKVARLAAVAGGALGVTLAIVSPTVIDALTIFYSLLSVSLFVPVVAGLYLRRAGRPEALAAIGAGVSLLLVVHLTTSGEGFGIWSPTLIGLVAATVGFGLVKMRKSHSGEKS